MLREVRRSHRNGTAFRSKWFLSIADQELEAGLFRGAFSDERAVFPDAARVIAVREGAELVAARVPPSADARHHLGDALVAFLGPVSQELV